jgi:hypothetical protein
MRRFALAVPFLAVPLAAAACGGSKSGSTSAAALPDDPAAAVRGAAVKTVAAGSEHLTIDGRVDTGTQIVTVRGAGDFDTKKHLGSLHADFSAGGLNGAIDAVSSGSTAYLKSDLLSAFLPAGKTWVKLDLAKTATTQGIDIASFLSQDPTKALVQLQNLRNVTKVGEVQLGGETTSHYRAGIDVSKLKGAARGETGRYDVWIGEDGYVHRVKASLTTGGETSTVTTDLSSFGEDVSVDLPKPAETFAGNSASIPGLGG